MKAGKNFSFYGETLSYDKDQVEYNRIRHRFESFAKENSSKIYQEYDNFGGLDKFYENFVDWVAPYLRKCCDIALEELGKYKYFSIELEEYYDDVLDCSALSDTLTPIEEYYEALAEKQAERKASHANRFHKGTHLRDSYYDGGDTTLTVAANVGGGIVAAGMNVLATGANFISDSIDKDDIYKKSRETVVPALINTIGSAYFELIEFARKECPDFTVENIPGKTVKEANAICKNLMSGKIAGKEAIDFVKNVLRTYPYNASLYEYVMCNFGDESRELQELAEFFHIDGLDKLQIKLLHESYKKLKLKKEEDAIAARDKMKKQASYLGMAEYTQFLPLERLITDYDLQYRTVCGIVYDTRDLADRNKELYKYYQTLDLTTTKKAALEAIAALEKKADSLEISAEWLAPYTKSALEKIQKKAWQSLDEFYKSLDLTDEQKAIAAREVMAGKAEELEIDNYKTYPPLEGLIVQFDEMARTVFEYRFKTREEAQAALTDESVFFLTVYTCIVETVKKTSAFYLWRDISTEKQAAIKETLALKDQPLVFADSTLLKTAKNGLAITPSGLTWNNGSALLQSVASNVVFKTLFKKKSQEMLEQHSVNSFSISWKEFFSSDSTFSVDEKKMMAITADKSFEASNTKTDVISAMFQKIRDWGKTVKFEFSDTPVPVPADSKLCPAPELTAIPSSVSISVSKAVEPFPDNTVLLQRVAKFRKKDDSLMIAPEIPEEQHNNFIGELNEVLQKKAASEIAICQADYTLMFKNGKKGFLLTNEALYYHDSVEFMVELSDIIGVDYSDKYIEISCADFNVYALKGAGTESLAKLLASLIKK